MPIFKILNEINHEILFYVYIKIYIKVYVYINGVYKKRRRIYYRKRKINLKSDEITYNNKIKVTKIVNVQKMKPNRTEIFIQIPTLITLQCNLLTENKLVLKRLLNRSYRVVHYQQTNQ